MSDGLDGQFERRPTADPGRGPGRWRRRARRLAMVGLILTITGAVAGLVGGYLIDSHLSGNVHRVPGAFQGIDPSARPSSNPAVHSQTTLAVGLDVRSADQTTGDAATDPQASAGERSDTIMLIRFDPAKQSASVVSIPRDSWVPIPGKGTMKINAAYALGGPPLLISTVEQLTGVRIDHFMVIDFAGFRSVVNALGGVDVQVAAATTDLAGTHLRQGANHLDGTEALAYVRQRHGLPQGDLDRIRRQQSFLRAVLTKMAAVNPAGDPLKTYQLLDAMTKAVTVDDGYTDDQLRALALDAAGLRAGKVWFLTAPVRGTGWEGDQSVVYLDPTRDADLWRALGNDTMPEYVDAHRADLLPAETP
jgi:LCP family protein required for cell wall assembly